MWLARRRPRRPEPDSQSALVGIDLHGGGLPLRRVRAVDQVLAAEAGRSSSGSALGPRARQLMTF